MTGTQTVVFLHGAGQTAASWDGVIAALPSGVRGVAVGVSLPPSGQEFSLTTVVSDLVAELDQDGSTGVHLCGLSLGAIVALQVAIDHPDRVKTLALSAGQVRPNPVLMAIQNAVIRILPARAFRAGSVDKRTLLNLLAIARDVDFRGTLGKVSTKTLVMCGAKDRANLPAARTLATGIPNARLNVVPGVGHTWNTEHPALFARTVSDFIGGLHEPPSGNA